MAGLRNTEAAALDATIGTLLTQFTSYDNIVVTGEAANTPAKYFLRSLFQNLQSDQNLKQIMIQAGYMNDFFRPISLAEAASPTIVLIDPKGVA